MNRERTPRLHPLLSTPLPFPTEEECNAYWDEIQPEVERIVEELRANPPTELQRVARQLRVQAAIREALSSK